MLDGNTRFALDVEPAELDGAPAAFRRLVADLQLPVTSEQEKRWRSEGGRFCQLPLPQTNILTRGVAADVKVAGARRESLTFNVSYVAYFRINVETGAAILQLRTPVLWAVGYETAASRWFDLILWWMTGRRCTLGQAAHERWRTTGIELCSDFVGVDYSSRDQYNFVGFRATETIRQFSRDDSLETMNFGTRRSPISLCIYDKDLQIARKKGGDDTAYRALHKENGWDGMAPRRRVEFRVCGRGLQLYDEDTGEYLDFRDPAVLANRMAMRVLWVLLAYKKRLVLPDTATRKERRHTDPRWVQVMACAAVSETLNYRQTRETQTDAWHEAVKRAQRDSRRGMHRLAALHDVNHEKVRLSQVLSFMQDATPEDDKVAGKKYQGNYRATREEYLGEEIRTLGAARWAKHVRGEWEY